jgi:glycosyltransferase involved in cell wall biosynthesis
MSSNGHPTISVAIAAFNAERWIGETLDSVLNQTRDADEVIVIDDGSTDGTAAALEGFAGRVRVIRQANRGVSAALNRAFAEARYEYVALCGADDLWQPRKLEWQVETLSANPEVDVAFGHARMFGVVEGDFERPTGTGVLDPAPLIRRLYAGNIIAAPSALIRRSLHRRLGGFREDLAGEDYEFWMHCLREGAVFHYDPRLVLHYRRHGDNLSMPGGGERVRLPLLEMNYVVHRAYADLVPADTAQRALAKDLCDAGRHFVALGDERRAAGALRASIRRRPSLRALIWLALLQLPSEHRERLVRLVISTRKKLIERVRAWLPSR